MNTELNFFLLVFIVLLMILTIYLPVSGRKEIEKVKKGIADGDYSKRLEFYYSTIFWPWLPVLLIFSLIPMSGISLDSLGIRWINIDTSSLSKWIIYPTIGFYVLYLLYNVYSIIIFKTNKESRAKIANSIPEDSRWVLPVTQKEKRVWTLLSISAGTTEEIIYRGYLFYTLAVVFPGLSILQILFISTLIFGIGHIYLGKEAIKSTMLGLVFGIFYIVFNSLIPVIIIHIAQDLVVRDILEEETERKE